MEEAPWLEAAGSAMWALVDRHTGQVGYGRGIKAAGLDADPPTIDCSGWAALLLTAGMKAANGVVSPHRFSDDDVAFIDTWSDRMIEAVERQTGWVLEGDEIAPGKLPPYATIGLRQGGGAWANNRPRPRGVTHVVQLLQRPSDGAGFVTEAQGWAKPYGLRLIPLADWLEVTRPYLKRGEAWAVDAFADRPI